MSRILNFEEISNYTTEVGLELPLHHEDFFIFSYDEADQGSNFALQAFRNHFFEITIDIISYCEYTVDQFRYHYTKQKICFISPFRLQSVYFPKVEPEHIPVNNCYSLFFKPHFLEEHLSGATLIERFPFFDPSLEPVLYLDAQELNAMEDIFQKMHRAYNQYRTDSDEIIRHYLFILLLISNKCFQSHKVYTQKVQRGYEIYYLFNEVLQSHVNKYSTVMEFADHLALSPKHLSETVKKVSGKTALQLINEKKL